MSDKSKQVVAKTGYVPRKLQLLLHKTIKRFCVLVFHRRWGKCLVRGSKVPTTDGFKSIEDLVIGDTVFTEYGKPTKVTGVYSPGARGIYRVIFDTGETVDTDATHRWYVEPAYSKVARVDRVPFKCGSYKDTYELRPGDFIPMGGAAEYPERDLVIDPYLLGAWLGDGSKDEGLLTICNGDESIVSGFDIKSVRDSVGCSKFRITGLLTELKSLDLYKNKHIPKIYLMSSVSQRMELLRGLMDTDGTVSNSGQCVFDQKDPILTAQVLELVRSLGLKATMKARDRGIKGISLAVSFSAKGFIPFNLKRKADLVRINDRPIRRQIKEVIRLTKKEDVFCIMVENDSHLFLTSRGYIPTHNTVFSINEQIDSGLRNKLRNPQYAYVAPTYKQAKQIAWQYFKDFTRNIPGVNPNKSELTVYIERAWRVCPLTGDADADVIKFMLIGADDPDSLRGLYLDGAILDEYAQCDPSIWGEILRPALSDRKSEAKEMGLLKDPDYKAPWAIFIGTPKGQNHFFKRYNKAAQSEAFCNKFESENDIEVEEQEWDEFEAKYGILDGVSQQDVNNILAKLSDSVVSAYKEWRKYKSSSNWFTKVYRASETGIIGSDEMDEMIEDLDEEEVQQELECSFTAAIKGSFFGHILNLIHGRGQIGNVPYNPAYPVDTFWDIGVGDKTTIWFRQKIGGRYYYIDYFEKNGKGLEFYAKVLEAKQGRCGSNIEVDKGEFIEGQEYRYGRHLWPHDGKAKEFGTGQTRQERARQKYGLAVNILKRVAISDRIDAARERLKVSFFDEARCSRGLECLYNYQKEYDSKRAVFKETPLHDWSSHGSDSYCYSALDDKDSTLEMYAGAGRQMGPPLGTANGEYNELGGI